MSEKKDTTSRVDDFTESDIRGLADDLVEDHYRKFGHLSPDTQMSLTGNSVVSVKYFNCHRHGTLYPSPIFRMRKGGPVGFCPICSGSVRPCDPPPSSYRRLGNLYAEYDMVGYVAPATEAQKEVVVDAIMRAVEESS